MKVEQVRRLIREAISDHIDRINKAGDIGAAKAKISAIDEKLMEADQLKKHLNIAVSKLKEYVNPKLVDSLLKELDKGVEELNREKEKLSKSLTSGSKSTPKKEEKPKKDKEDKK
jgi:chemotaxis regulatin CheY-phosphate phosphatase CheZ